METGWIGDGVDMKMKKEVERLNFILYDSVRLVHHLD